MRTDITSIRSLDPAETIFLKTQLISILNIWLDGGFIDKPDNSNHTVHYEIARNVYSLYNPYCNDLRLRTMDFNVGRNTLNLLKTLSAKDRDFNKKQNNYSAIEEILDCYERTLTLQQR